MVSGDEIWLRGAAGDKDALLLCDICMHVWRHVCMSRALVSSQATNFLLRRPSVSNARFLLLLLSWRGHNCHPSLLSAAERASDIGAPIVFD